MVSFPPLNDMLKFSGYSHFISGLSHNSRFSQEARMRLLSTAAVWQVLRSLPRDRRTKRRFYTVRCTISVSGSSRNCERSLRSTRGQVRDLVRLACCLTLLGLRRDFPGRKTTMVRQHRGSTRLSATLSMCGGFDTERNVLPGVTRQCHVRSKI